MCGFVLDGAPQHVIRNFRTRSPERVLMLGAPFWEAACGLRYALDGLF